MNLKEYSDKFKEIQETSRVLQNTDLDRGDSIQIDLINELAGKMNTLSEFGFLNGDQYDDLFDFLISTRDSLDIETWDKTHFKMLDNLILFSDFLVNRLDKLTQDMISYDVIGSLKK